MAYSDGDVREAVEAAGANFKRLGVLGAFDASASVAAAA